MEVKDVMTSNVRLATPDQSISESARIMAECDSGVVPVYQDDRLVGMVTDRDIVVRAVANNLAPSTPVREVMSQEVLYCYEDEDIEQVAKNMAKNQIRRLPVLNRSKRLVGIVSIGDLSKRARPHATGEAIAEISKPGGQHSQKTH
jgi:CBS domain-containing protein